MKVVQGNIVMTCSDRTTMSYAYSDIDSCVDQPLSILCSPVVLDSVDIISIIPNLFA